MDRKLFLAAVIALCGALAAANTALSREAEFTGPGPGVTGNNTGGIFPYSPDVEGSYNEIAEAHCARYGRLAKVTSIHRVYGDYVSFVCYDRPPIIH